MRIVYSLKPADNPNKDENLKIEDDNLPNQCDAPKLGASIESEGLNKGLVNNLKSKPKTYFITTDLGGWGFPDNKGFKIEVYEFDANKNRNTDPGVTIAPLGEHSEDANVFVKEINTVYLNQDNTRDPVVVHIEVW
jgi:hypothetical protein